MSDTLLKPKFACKAANPGTCRYHGAFVAMEKALKTNDFTAYEKAKSEVLENQKNSRSFKQQEKNKPEEIKPPGFMWLSGRTSLIINSSYYRDQQKSAEAKIMRFDRAIAADKELYSSSLQKLSKVYDELSNSENESNSQDGKRVDIVIQRVEVAKILNEVAIAKLDPAGIREYLEKRKFMYQQDYNDTWVSLSKFDKFNGGSSISNNITAIEAANRYNATVKMLDTLDK